MDIKAAWSNIQLAYKQPRYWWITALIAVVFYSFTALLNNIKAVAFALWNDSLMETIKLAFLLILGYHNTIRTISLALLSIISILLGILFSLLIFKHLFFNHPQEKRRAGVLASIGALLGALAPACTVCGVGIFYVLGLGSAFISFLPLHGIEFSLLAIVILLTSAYLLAKNLTSCSV